MFHGPCNSSVLQCFKTLSFGEYRTLLQARVSKTHLRLQLPSLWGSFVIRSYNIQRQLLHQLFSRTSCQSVDNKVSNNYSNEQNTFHFPLPSKWSQYMSFTFNELEQCLQLHVRQFWQGIPWMQIKYLTPPNKPYNVIMEYDTATYISLAAQLTLVAFLA